MLHGVKVSSVSWRGPIQQRRRWQCVPGVLAILCFYVRILAHVESYNISRSDPFRRCALSSPRCWTKPSESVCVRTWPAIWKELNCLSRNAWYDLSSSVMLISCKLFKLLISRYRGTCLGKKHDSGSFRCLVFFVIFAGAKPDGHSPRLWDSCSDSPG